MGCHLYTSEFLCIGLSVYNWVTVDVNFMQDMPGESTAHDRGYCYVCIKVSVSG